MSWHGACASGTSRVLSVASLHWFKMDVPIPAPAECEVRSVIKFLNAQGIAPIEIDRQLCQVYGQADGNEFQSLGRAIVKEDEYEEVRRDDIVSIVSWRERVFRLWWEESAPGDEGGRVAQLVEQLATDWKVQGSIPGGDGVFSRCQTFRTAPRFTQPPIKLSTGSFPGVKVGQSVVPTTSPHSSAEVMESMGLYLHAPQVPSWHVTGIP
ncbi:hypothetical protein ANN_12464 [Periplaneta americana]|uniref:Uncharacterized protein n=1 Tax=Periplaneta americana TaxID=6978 RepID=A0ABQ8TGR6_PERAM|nr:hypothetical protein ANN_12464 [Periplaneta americana]